MSNGVQVFGDGGITMLDSSDRIGRLIGTYPIVNNGWPTISGWIPVSGMVNDGTWFVFGAYNTGDLYFTIGNGGFNWNGYNSTGPYNSVATVMRF
jgi:hypothetical protein